MLKVWNLNLVVATFVLTILGTFLTRSGILSSVHAFTEGTIGYYFLVFIALTLVVSLALVTGFAGDLRSEGKLDAIASRESVFMLNNLLLSAFTFTVLLGTLFPLVAEAVRGVKVTVGRPFFNMMTFPIAVLLLFLIGVGPLLPWRRADVGKFKKQLRVPAIAGGLAAIATIVFTRDPYAIGAFAFGIFAIVANLEEFWAPTRVRVQAHDESYLPALGRVIRSNPHRYGGYIAHLGVLAAALGIAASSAFKYENEATLKPGESFNVQNVAVRLDRVWGQEQPHRFTVGADVALLKNGKVVAAMAPRQNFYAQSDQPYPSPDVRSRPTRDIYLNLMAFAQDGSTATVRAMVEPMVGWIWFGGGMMVFGVLVALWPMRRAVAEVAPVAEKAKKHAPAAAPKRKLVPAEVDA